MSLDLDSEKFQSLEELNSAVQLDWSGGHAAHGACYHRIIGEYIIYGAIYSAGLSIILYYIHGITSA